MALFRLGGHLASKTLILAMSPDTMPSSVGGVGTIVSLGTFEHALGQAEGDDVLPGSEGHGFPHSIWAHVQDILYKRSASDLTNTMNAKDWPDTITDFENWKMLYNGVYATSEGLHVVDPTAALTSGSPTVTLVTKHLPSGTAIVVGQLDFTALNPTIATVSTAGVVTRVAAGEARVRVQRKDRRFGSTTARIICT